MINRKAVLPLAAIAVAAVAVPSIAVGRSAHSAATVTAQTVKVAGTGNSGYYTPAAVSFKLGTKKVQWAWDNTVGTSQHDVTFEPTGSVSLSNAQKPKNSLTVAVPPRTSTARNYVWPSATTYWTPPKAGKYIFYCTKHPGAGKAHTGGMVMTVTVS